jgi:ubiquitin C-terminal hydrolase
MIAKCPYCGETVRIWHEGDGQCEDEPHAKECGHCGKTFGYKVALLLELTDVSQAPCLNDGPHTWQGFRRCIGLEQKTMRRCQHCGIEEETKP